MTDAWEESGARLAALGQALSAIACLRCGHPAAAHGSMFGRECRECRCFAFRLDDTDEHDEMKEIERLREELASKDEIDRLATEEVCRQIERAKAADKRAAAASERLKAAQDELVNVVKLVTSLQNDNTRLRMDLAFERQRTTRLSCDQPHVSSALVPKLIQLCHPDRHGLKLAPLANEVTAKLLEMRR